MLREDGFWRGRRKLPHWGTSRYRFLPPELPLRSRKFAPLWTDHSQPKSSSRSKPTSGISKRNDLSSIARVSIPEIKETTRLKDLWNEAEAQKIAGNQL